MKVKKNNDEKIINDNEIRPHNLNNYIGQKDVSDKFTIYIEAAKKRNEVLDHVLLFGPPGLGKTTLAHIISNEMNVNIKVISAPSLERTGDLASVLSLLEPGDILFIDEIHRLSKNIEEVLYSVMEDFVLDILVGIDGEKNAVRIDIAPFTLVGATTKIGMLSSPLRDRFGIIEKLNFYSVESLAKIVIRTSEIFGIKIDDCSSYNISKRSRGTPRIANRLLRRIRDYADVKNNGVISLELSNFAFKKLNIDENGLNKNDLEYLFLIKNSYNNGPVGIESLSTSMDESVSTIEETIEPFLIKIGYISRTTRGRQLTINAIKYLGRLENEY